MSKEQSLNKTIAQVWEDKYVIPLYQRNFAWTENEIGQLLQDLYDNSPKSEKDDCSNYYLGSLVVLERRDGLLEVIDGQQRLTALHLICKYLDVLKVPCITYDSRPEVESFFTNLFAKPWNEATQEYAKIDNNKISRLRDALEIVEHFKIRTGNDDGTISLNEMSSDKRSLLARYILHNVILVRIPLPQDTDVASYFEIMNNRGEQLQSHEIIKAILMRELDDNKRYIFATIWDGCSQMDRPIQQSLSQYRNAGLFGNDFETLNFDCLRTAEKDSYNLGKECDIEKILNDSKTIKIKDNSCDESDIKYRAIIDFPNFLMHVFRLYKSKSTPSDNTEIPLNADAIPTEKPAYITDSMDFIKFLLKTRTLFDRYVIKMQGQDDEDENLKWKLLRPYKYDYNDKHHLKLKYTFSNTEDNDNYDENYSRKSKIIKQQSMLQVSFRNRKYKEWLYAILDWLSNNTTDNHIESITETKLATFLDSWIVEYYQKLKTNWENKNQDLFTAGTDTPHFLLNFIDYLYWCASLQEQTTIRYAKQTKDFQFKYYNSVEHHLPQSYQNTNREYTDKIGNLCLISKRKNSSLNDKGPTEKAKIEPGIQPNRSIMYQITYDKGRWGEEEIKEHQQDIQDLIAQIPNLIAE